MEVGNFENLNEFQIPKVSEEILDHMMNPKNYGEMKDPHGVGIGSDTKTAEFAMVYIHVVDGILDNITFGANACQDTVVAGSLFTEMVKGDTLENAISASKLMDEKLEVAPKKQQACSRLILRGFDAAVVNRKNKLAGNDEDLYKINIKESCEIDKIEE